MEGLIVGRVVHYVPGEDDPGYGKQMGPSSQRAAVINALEEGDLVRLTVFADPIYDGCIVWSANTIPYSLDHAPRSWHWPEEVVG